jgi:thiol-disulfide isomerase/thioredoxin
MTQMTLLHPGDPFPTLTVALAEGRALRLPDALAGHYGVVLFYRGSWCPYCNAQLRAFQRSLDRFADMDTLVIATTGAFVNNDPMYLQSTGFVLDPRGLVVVSVYSSGAIGRLVPEDVIGLIRYLREHAPASQSS